ncbi:DUF6233 domain-containing protein [Streptomyces spectabilis]|uniref:Uncharacterized protein n=1 Tax=Streptomyces spectabilis TaxID=68270 RepID=A0A7W8EZG5_STRST|nr:DUF6233 domain-containing protein [Streptomyces spectabilis]MBB5109139.1 hypothetical protein [Streptomyces spectabilis]MCI3907691.1 DUF6233 domain-containing protein [Streptomyces spectabilis]MCI3907701.1 DUF6233 domain-containing protein [Streptomyces spectabilis]
MPPESDQPPPEIIVVLPDAQEVRGRLLARKQTGDGAWLYLVSLPIWHSNDQHEIVAMEYRTWLQPRPDQLRPIDGVEYSAVPTEPLVKPAPDVRWAWTVERVKQGHRTAGTVVHSYDCAHSPKGAEELNEDQALTELRRPGARACQDCDAAAALGPLV